MPDIASISWPATLPLPFLDYSGDPRNTTIQSNLEDGPIQRRSRSSKTYASISVTWILGLGQYEAFKTFFAEDLGNGVAQFSIELRYPKNTALTVWLVRFRGGFEATYLDGKWSVAAELDLVDRAEVAEVAGLEGWGPFMVDPDSSSAAEDHEFETADGFIYHVET